MYSIYFAMWTKNRVLRLVLSAITDPLTVPTSLLRIPIVFIKMNNDNKIIEVLILIKTQLNK